MINASAQNMPFVVSCDSVLDLAPLVARNLSEVAVAILNLGNQLINLSNFTLQFESLLAVCCIFIFFFFSWFLFLLIIFFLMLTAMVLEATAPLTLFAVTAGVFVSNGVHSIVGMVPLPFCCSGEFSLVLV
jgi:hypothetical protein